MIISILVILGVEDWPLCAQGFPCSSLWYLLVQRERRACMRQGGAAGEELVCVESLIFNSIQNIEVWIE